jgi:hypothetical protein
VLDGYYGTALPLLAQAVLGFEVLHASAVLLDGLAVAFSAWTGVGKSTIASAFNEQGFALWADDAVAIAARKHEVPVSVFLPFMRDAGNAVTAGPTEDVRLGAICLLQRVEKQQAFGGAAIQRVSPANSVATLLSNAYRFAPVAAQRRRKMANTYLDVAARTPVFLVRFATDRHRLSNLVAEIESAVRKATA